MCLYYVVVALQQLLECLLIVGQTRPVGDALVGGLPNFDAFSVLDQELVNFDAGVASRHPETLGFVVGGAR